ncbi:MAG TPA: hypothetical protein DDW65_24890 [Firmicutes bacterium]|nr:hypothetical protein [Bacillota bacterium]
MFQYAHHYKKKTLIMVWLIFCVGFVGVWLNSSVVHGATADGEGKTDSAKTSTDSPAFETEYSVGIIDLTYGNIESATDSDQYPSKIKVDGHIAFYLKGKVRGKYLLTAQMDTGEKSLSELWQNLYRKDSSDVLSKIDPERYYPVYGDQSTIVNDVSSSGKLYVRLEWDQSKILLGDYQFHLNQTELLTYNRSLYGVYINLVSPDKTGIASKQTQVFAAEPLSLHSSDILQVTGGMLYYLKHSDIVLNSEQIKVEVRSSISGSVLNSISLQYGRDYDLDYAQGRIMLRRELSTIVSGDEITTNLLNAGNYLFLVVDYDFEGTDLATVRPNYGFRTSFAPFANLKLGSSYIKEAADDGGDYQGYGFDYHYQLTSNIALIGEWAQSEQSLNNRYYSEDGGMSYAQIASSSLEEGEAWKFGFIIGKGKQAGENPLTLQVYTIRQQAGYSTTETETLHDTEKNHLEINGELCNGLYLHVNGDSTAEATIKDTGDVLAQLSENLGKWKHTQELRYQIEDDYVNNAYYQDVLGAYRLDYFPNSNIALYGIQQLTLAHNDATPQNNRSTIGTNIRLNSKTVFNLETSTGDLGNAIKSGCEYQISENQKLYGNTKFETDQDAGKTIVSTIGGRDALNEHANVYSEHQISSGTYENNISDVIGFDYTLQNGWLLSANYTQSQVVKLADRPDDYPFEGITSLDDQEPDGSFERRIIGGSMVYHQDALQFKTALEARYDDGDTRLRQYLLTNSYRNDLNRDYAFYCKLNYSVTRNLTLETDTARFVEAVLGLAYRPVMNDRLNLIGQYSYRDELTPEGQDDDESSLRERWQIISIEGMYDLSPHWQWGEKVAFKHTDLLLETNDSNWAGNDLWLWINRINYRLPFHWDISAEYRILKDIQAGDDKSGFLLALYYNFNLHNRIGAGYNFTDFNDDLAYLSYHARGFFVNFSYQW